MEIENRFWKVRHKNRFLLEVMRHLAGNAQISFEGGSEIVGLAEIPGASQIETSVLKRNTLAPRLEFVVVPLEISTIPAIFAGIGGTIPKSVLHILIEKNGQLEFGAYDNFHPECIVLGPATSGAALESLISKGLLVQVGTQR